MWVISIKSSWQSVEKEAKQKYVMASQLPIQRINRLGKKGHDERDKKEKNRKEKQLSRLVVAQLTGVGHIMDEKV